MSGQFNNSSVEARRVSGASDARLIAILVAATLALGVAGILAVPFISAQDRSGDVIESYTATLRRDGTLLETYVYTLKSSDTRMLFRYWEENLDYDAHGRGNDNIVLMNVVAPEGSVAYIKNQNGQVIMLTPTHSNLVDARVIGELAYLNEAGCYDGGYFPPGSYTVSYMFKINFLIDSDGVSDHLNLMLASDHLPYRNVRVVLEDADYVSEVFQHPPSLRVTREGDDIVISGSSAENEMLEVEMLMVSGAHGFRTIYNSTLDLKVQTEQANSLYSIQFWSAYGLGLLAKAAVLLVPLAFLVLWMRYGRDEDVTVPPYLSTVPNPDRKPWLVNMVFDKGVDDLDENGFYATLLDLDRRNKIRIEPREGGMRIYILDKDVDDVYERKTMEFLEGLLTNDASEPGNPRVYFDTDTLKRLSDGISAGTGEAKALDAQSKLRSLILERSQLEAASRYKGPLIVVGLCIVPLVASRIDISTLFMALAFSMMAVFIIIGSTETMQVKVISLTGYFLEVSIAQMIEPQFIMFYIFAFFLIFTLIMVSRTRKEAKVAPVEKIKELEVSGEFFDDGRRRILWTASVGATLLAFSLFIYLWAPVVSYLLVTPAILGAVALIQVAAAYFSPQTIFGRWKEGLYKEKLEWEAFRAHLGDYSQLRRYSTEDLNMWGIWLVYGTALGVGDKVAKAMQSLNVKLESAIVATAAHVHFYPMVSARPMVSGGGGGGGKSHGGGHRGGGGHGGGGGRGRGGAGRR